MEIYLDSNATTEVHPSARIAALDAMVDHFGNPSSTHSAGLRARDVLETATAAARRVMNAANGRVIFTSGATEGIHTAVLSALTSLRTEAVLGGMAKSHLLYGATEHKAVPEALIHWNEILRLGLQIEAIPVGQDGRHDLRWLAEHAARAALVCTMAANNETGVISDLDGIAHALEGSGALWLVDSVQALGKLPLRLTDLPIDYAPVSGHKLFAPKGIGILYVREGAPFTPMFTGGGQEGGQRSGTENLPGIAAFGAVLSTLEQGALVQPASVLEGFRAEIINALISSFPGVVFNSPVEHSLPTTINFSVPGLNSKVLLDAFDSAGLRMSGGSACSASQTSPSHVLEAMGLESWRASSAVRLSFAPNVESKTISAACARIRACGTVLRANCLLPATSKIWIPPAELVTRYTVDGACSYLIADAASRRCVVVDPLPELTDQIANWLKCNFYTLVAAIDTHSHGDHVSSAAALRNAIPALQVDNFERDGLGWPVGQDEIFLGRHRLSRLPVPGHTSDSTAYLLHRGEALVFAFVGDTVMPGALGRSDFDQSEPIAFPSSLLALERVVGPDTLLLPAHDYENRFACTFRVESTVQPLLAAAVSGSIDAKEFAARKSELDRDIPQTRYCTMACGAPIPSACAQEEVELSLDEIKKLAGSGEPVIFVDVRERFEQKLGLALSLDVPAQRQSAPLSTLANVLPEWLQRPRAHIAFFCRSGNRSAQAARALRRLGHERAWSLDGGIALWAR